MQWWWKRGLRWQVLCCGSWRHESRDDVLMHIFVNHFLNILQVHTHPKNIPFHQSARMWTDKRITTTTHKWSSIHWGHTCSGQTFQCFCAGLNNSAFPERGVLLSCSCIFFPVGPALPASSSTSTSKRRLQSYAANLCIPITTHHLLLFCGNRHVTHTPLELIHLGRRWFCQFFFLGGVLFCEMSRVD